MTAFELPRWGAMWGTAVLIYSACKCLSWAARRPDDAPAWQHLAYLFLWPGMDADTFLGHNQRAIRRPLSAEWSFAFFKLSVGTVLLAAAILNSQEGNPTVVGWMGMIGIVLVLHFGLFHLLSCCWRSMDVLADPIMNWPLASRSLSEFWGRRWNLAFRDLTHHFLFQPVTRRLGATGGLLVGFLVSGLVHELVITVPAGVGRGGPTCYFLVQGAGILFEHCRLGRSWKLNRGATGRLFAAGCVILPLPLLFPQAFTHAVIVPFLQSLRTFL